MPNSKRGGARPGAGRPQRVWRVEFTPEEVAYLLGRGATVGEGVRAVVREAINGGPGRPAIKIPAAAADKTPPPAADDGRCARCRRVGSRGCPSCPKNDPSNRRGSG